VKFHNLVSAITITIYIFILLSNTHLGKEARRKVPFFD
jgi:hypothetical protein